MLRRAVTILSALALVCALAPMPVAFAEPAEGAAPELVFGDEGVIEAEAGSGYSIDGTTLTITAAGSYTISGSCADGAIVVEKSLSDVTLVLDNLALTSTTTAPIAVKKSSSVTVQVRGTSTLTDAENPDDPAIADTYEGAAIKLKGKTSLTFSGDGELVINGNANNGIKAGAEASLIFQGGTFTVNAVKNGIAADGSIAFSGGSYYVETGGDAIKSVPAEDDADSAGTVDISGGSFTIAAQGDGIQADSRLSISDGTIAITTLDGWDSPDFDGATMSCKGLKVSGDREGIAHELAISGGAFWLNTADDALHSDGDITVSAGTLSVYSGDDAVHADNALELGTDGGHELDPHIIIRSCFEGLEADFATIYSGTYDIFAIDDGINIVGDGDSYNQHGPISDDFGLTVYGGDLLLNCLEDGIDSNGDVLLYGGRLTISSASAYSPNSPLDANRDILIDGATVFASGVTGVDGPIQASWFGEGQAYAAWAQTLDKGKACSVVNGQEVLFSFAIPKKARYAWYSTPGITGTLELDYGGAVVPCRGGMWGHSLDDGTIDVEPAAGQPGLMHYTCTVCGATFYKTITQGADYSVCWEELPAPLPEFSDVPQDAWFHDVVQAAAARGLITGFGTVPPTFRPYSNITRGQVATILFRASGEAAVEENPFRDVHEGLYYSEGVKWCAAQGIVTGYGSGPGTAFRPSAAVSRQELCVMLARYVAWAGGSTATDSDAWRAKGGAGSVAAWATDAIAWAVSIDLIGSNGNLNPRGSATRAEAAKMILFALGVIE